MPQWLGFGAFTDVARVQSMVGELRSCKPRGMAEREREREREREKEREKLGKEQQN